MNTQSHAILTTALVRRTLGPRATGLVHLNPILVAGALAPDLPIFVLFGWYTWVEKVPQRVLWGEVYFRPVWQGTVSLFHSFPVWAGLAVVLFALGRPRGALFGVSGLLASLEDFFLHAEDAHAHFFPFSNWRFRSPVSYWDPAHHGVAASVVETAMVLAVSVWLWRRVETRWGRVALGLAAASMLTNHSLWVFLFRTFG